MGELRTFLRVSTSSLNSWTSRDPLWTFARSRSRASMSCATFSRSIFVGASSLASFLAIWQYLRYAPNPASWGWGSAGSEGLYLIATGEDCPDGAVGV